MKVENKRRDTIRFRYFITVIWKYKDIDILSFKRQGMYSRNIY